MSSDFDFFDKDCRLERPIFKKFWPSPRMGKAV